VYEESNSLETIAQSVYWSDYWKNTDVISIRMHTAVAYLIRSKDTPIARNADSSVNINAVVSQPLKVF